MTSKNEGLRKPGSLPGRLSLSYADVAEVDDDDHLEKTWQRVVSQITRKGKHLYEPVKSIPSYYIIILLGWYLLLGYLAQLIEDDMPAVISDYDIAKTDSKTFSETEALRFLDRILGDGPRVAGTKYHLQKTIDMKKLVDEISENSNLKIHTDWQIVSGASDNGVFCAVMAEILNRFSKRNEKFKHNIVFLFNGAEENPLQGSHGFLQHPWSKGIISVVNLDAAGMNGKPTVFQSSDVRVLNAYRRAVSRCNAQGLGELVFSSGLVPSDTDFRIFRDFGNIYGIDIAFSKWGVVYHTRYDHPDLLRAGVVQNAGNTVMALLSELADMEELKDKTEPTRAVYYDYLNLFMVTYSLSSVLIVDCIVLCSALLSVAYYVWLVGPRWSTVRELLIAVLSRIASAAAGAALVALCTGIMVLTTKQLRYLSRPWLCVPFYWIPYLLGAIATSHVIDKWRTKKSNVSRSIRCVQSAAACRLVLCCVLACVLCFPALRGGTYLVSLPLAIMSVGSAVSLTAVRYFRMTAWQHLLLEVLISLPSVMFLFSIALRLCALAIPILGRSPSLPPDFTMATISIVMATLCACTVCGTELLFSVRLLRVCVVAWLLCAVVMLLPLSPYSDDGPATMRHYWFHAAMSHDNMTRHGVVTTKLDVHTTRASEAAGGALACDHTLVYCGLPVFRTSMAKHLDEAMLLPAGPPATFSPPASMSHTHTCANNTCTYVLSFYGAPHNTIILSPLPGTALSGWSLSSPPPAPPNSPDSPNSPHYVIMHSHATYTDDVTPVQITVQLDVPPSLQAGPILRVSHHSHKIFHPEDFTEEYRNMVNDAPKYYNIASFISFRNDYEI